VYLPRALSPTPSLRARGALDRIGKGALSYVLSSEGEALIVDPSRHLDRYAAVVEHFGARVVGVGGHARARRLLERRAPAAASKWGVPYYLHPDDARSPYDSTPGRIDYEP